MCLSPRKNQLKIEINSKVVNGGRVLINKQALQKGIYLKRKKNLMQKPFPVYNYSCICIYNKVKIINLKMGNNLLKNNFGVIDFNYLKKL